MLLLVGPPRLLELALLTLEVEVDFAHVAMSEVDSYICLLSL